MGKRKRKQSGSLRIPRDMAIALPLVAPKADLQVQVGFFMAPGKDYDVVRKDRQTVRAGIQFFGQEVERRYAFFATDASGNLVQLPWVPIVGEEADRFMCLHHIRLGPQKSVAPPSNSVLVVRIHNRKCNFGVGEVSLVRQDTNWFNPHQPLYRGQCFRDGEQVVCRYLDAERTVPDMIVQLLAERFYGREDLPDISSFSPEIVELSLDRVEDNVAVVQRYRYASNRGLLITKEGTAQVSWREVYETGNFKHLRRGQVVSYGSLKRLPDSDTEYSALRVRPIE